LRREILGKPLWFFIWLFFFLTFFTFFYFFSISPQKELEHFLYPLSHFIAMLIVASTTYKAYPTTIFSSHDHFTRAHHYLGRLSFPIWETFITWLEGKSKSKNMSQGQLDVPEPQDGDISKSENSTPLDKQTPGSGIRVEESVPMDISSKTASPKLTPEVVPANDSMEFSKDEDAELEEEVAAVTKVIASVSDKAANVATRRNWRKAVVGTEHVESFLVRAILKTSTPHVRRKALDEQAEKLLTAASDEFLDRALVKRLKTIDAGVLVKMLAKAGRLGFSDNDMVDTDEIVQPVDAPMRRRASVGGPLRPEEQLAPLQIDLAHPSAQNQTLPQISRDHIPSPPLQNQMQQLPPIQYMPSGPPFQQQQVALPTRAIVPANKHSCPDCGQTFAQSAGRKYVDSSNLGGVCRLTVNSIWRRKSATIRLLSSRLAAASGNATTATGYLPPTLA
jgi:hypothetical protein